MFNKRTTCYDAKCRRIGNQHKNIIQIGNMDQNAMIWIVLMKFLDETSGYLALHDYI